MTNIGAAVGKDTIKTYQNTANINGKALYIGSGTSIGSDATATASLTGLDDFANFTTGDKLTLFKADGTKVEFLIDTALAHGTAQALKIGINGANTGQVEASVKAALENAGFGTVTVGGADGAVSIEQSAAGPAGNSEALGAEKQNSVTKTGGNLAVTQFTGGTKAGLTSANTNATFTAGKFLIRVTGFAAPADL